LITAVTLPPSPFLPLRGSSAPNLRRLGTGSMAAHALDRLGDLLRVGALPGVAGVPTDPVRHRRNSGRSRRRSGADLEAFPSTSRSPSLAGLPIET
ncbi:unnamed protein product, partial [Urochloa humidicola]